MTIFIVSYPSAGLICGSFTSYELAEEHIRKHHYAVPNYYEIVEYILDSDMCQSALIHASV